MKVIIDGLHCIISRDEEDKPIKTESALLHRVKIILNMRQYRLIKKLAYKDGHMINNTQYYLRSRNKKKGIMIYDRQYAMHSSVKELLQHGQVIFSVEKYP